MLPGLPASPPLPRHPEPLPPEATPTTTRSPRACPPDTACPPERDLSGCASNGPGPGLPCGCARQTWRPACMPRAARRGAREPAEQHADEGQLTGPRFRAPPFRPAEVAQPSRAPPASRPRGRAAPAPSPPLREGRWGAGSRQSAQSHSSPLPSPTPAAAVFVSVPVARFRLMTPPLPAAAGQTPPDERRPQPTSSAGSRSASSPASHRSVSRRMNCENAAASPLSWADNTSCSHVENTSGHF